MEAKTLRAEAEAMRERTAAAGLSEAELEIGRNRLLNAATGSATATARVSRALLWAGLAATACAAAAGWFLIGPQPGSDSLLVTAGASCAVVEQGEVRSRTRCHTPVVLALDEDEVTLAEDTSVRRQEDGLRVKRGRARFRIRGRKTGQGNFTVYVSHGAIVVVGTAFTVVQLRDSGSVQVEQGRVQFHWNDGSPPQRLLAGESLSWPRNSQGKAAEPVPDQHQPAVGKPRDRHGEPTPTDSLTRRPAADRSAQQVMQRLFQLRAQRRYAEATRLLQKASDDARYSARQRARLTYELGRLLEGQGKRAAACELWRSFPRRFRGSARLPEVRRLAAVCPEAP